MIPPFLLGPLFGAAGMGVAGPRVLGMAGIHPRPNVRAAQVAEIAALTAKRGSRRSCARRGGGGPEPMKARVRGNEHRHPRGLSVSRSRRPAWPRLLWLLP